MALPTPSSHELSTCKSHYLLGRKMKYYSMLLHWLELLHCIRTQLAHPLQSVNWLGTGQYLIQNNSTCTKFITDISTLAGLHLSGNTNLRSQWHNSKAWSTEKHPCQCSHIFLHPQDGWHWSLQVCLLWGDHKGPLHILWCICWPQLSP